MPTLQVKLKGIIIQIAHSGSNYKPFDLKGTLPGNPPKYKVMESIIDRNFPDSDILSTLLFIGTFSGFLIIIVKENQKTTWDIGLMIISIIPLIFFCFLLIVKTRPYIAQFTSKKLSNYDHKFQSDWNLNSKKSNLKLTKETEATKEIDGINFIIERQIYTK